MSFWEEAELAVVWLVRLFFVKRDAREACAACRRGFVGGQPRISSPPAESGDRQHTPHGLVFQGGRGGGYSTGRSLCSTLVENTICVLVRPNCWSSLMKWSSSMVERKATSMSME